MQERTEACKRNLQSCEYRKKVHGRTFESLDYAFF